MKILAIEKQIKPIDWEKESQTLIEEANSVYKMMLSGDLREIYFTANKNAVLILECKNKIAAVQLLAKLPLVIKGIIEFDILVLQPYNGFTRLMDFD